MKAMSAPPELGVVTAATVAACTSVHMAVREDLIARDWVEQITAAFLEATKRHGIVVEAAARVREAAIPGEPPDRRIGVFETSIASWDRAERRLIQLVNGYQSVGAGPQHAARHLQLAQAFGRQVDAGRAQLRWVFEAAAIRVSQPDRLLMPGSRLAGRKEN